MERSRGATINSAYSISHVAASKQIYLMQYGLMAERHWRELRPRMVREMQNTDTLMESLFEAQERTIEEMKTLTRQWEIEHKMTPPTTPPKKLLQRVHALFTDSSQCLVCR